MKKLIISLCLCIVMILPYHTSAQAIYNDNDMPLDLVINDTYVTPSLPLIEYRGTVFIAVRSLCELLWVEDYSWNAKSETLTVRHYGNEAKLKEHSNVYTINGVEHYLPQPAETVNGRMYVPVRFAQAMFGIEVGWDAKYYNVTFKLPAYTLPAKYVNNYYQQEDVFWLARIVYAESRGEPAAGKLAVANVILNRVKSPQFPNTVYGVIFDRKYGVQYTPTINGAIYNTPDTASIMAAKRALHGENNVGGSLYFYNPRIAGTNWISRNRPYYTTIGNHSFYL